MIGDTVDLPVSKAGGACHNQAPVIANNIAAEIRLGAPIASTTDEFRPSRKWASMPACHFGTTTAATSPTPPTKLGGLLRHGFNRGLYWAVARECSDLHGEE